MTNEEKKTRLEEVLKDQDMFKVLDIRDINHDPHPYCITNKHITERYASLDKNTIMALERDNVAHCGMYTDNQGNWRNGRKGKYENPCTLPYEKHTSVKVVFLQLLRDVKKEESAKVFKGVFDTLGGEFLDGITFVETEEEFRII